MTTLLAHAMRDAAAAARRPPATGPCNRPGRSRRHRRTFAENTWTGQQIIAGYALRPGPDEEVRPDLVDVEIPVGRRPVADPDEAVAVLQDHPVNATLRVDSYATRMAVCAALGRFVGTDAMALVSHDVIAQRASAYAGYRIARATAGDHVRALEDAGAIVVAFRGRSAVVAGRNLASVYVVTAPADTLTPHEQDALADLTARLAAATAPTSPRGPEAASGDEPDLSFGDELRQHPFREVFDLDAGLTQDRTTGYFSGPKSPSDLPASPWSVADAEKFAPMKGGTPLRRPRTLLRDVAQQAPAGPRAERPEAFTARTDAERRAAAAWLIHRLGWTYTRADEDEAVTVCRDFFAAGWTAAALVRAFFTQPDGSPFPGPLDEPNNRDRANPVRITRRWGLITWRMQKWRQGAAPGRRFGSPLPPPVPAETPRRGRPPIAVTQHRRHRERVERMPTTDPQRAVELAVLRGDRTTVSWRPRSDDAEAAVAALRETLPTGLRRADRIARAGTAATLLITPVGAPGSNQPC